MADGFTITLPTGTRGGKGPDREITVSDLTSESFSHFVGSGAIKMPDFGKIKIKSYYQRTLMQSMANLLGSFAAGFKAGAEGVSNMDSGKLDALGKKIQDVITGLTLPGAFRSISDALLAGIASGPDAAIYDLPRIISKGLFATEAGTNLILPFPALGSNTLITSDGSYGWGQGEQLSPFGHSTGLAGAVLKTLAINITPMFSPGKGGGETPTITISFDLINDTFQKWQAHKSFIKGVASQNMWIQYGLVQGPGALYDVRVGDYMSYFMCTGNIQATGKGTWRKKGGDDIPDVFAVTMTFKSLLPNNYNAYVWGQDPGGFDSKYYGAGGEGFLTKLLNNAKTAFEQASANGATIRGANEANKAAEAAAAAATQAGQNLQAAEASADATKAAFDTALAEAPKADANGNPISYTNDDGSLNVDAVMNSQNQQLINAYNANEAAKVAVNDASSAMDAANTNATAAAQAASAATAAAQALKPSYQYNSDSPANVDANLQDNK